MVSARFLRDVWASSRAASGHTYATLKRKYGCIDRGGGVYIYGLRRCSLRLYYPTRLPNNVAGRHWLLGWLGGSLHPFQDLFSLSYLQWSKDGPTGCESEGVNHPSSCRLKQPRPLVVNSSLSLPPVSGASSRNPARGLGWPGGWRAGWSRWPAGGRSHRRAPSSWRTSAG